MTPSDDVGNLLQTNTIKLQFTLEVLRLTLFSCMLNVNEAIVTLSTVAKALRKLILGNTTWSREARVHLNLNWLTASSSLQLSSAISRACTVALGSGPSASNLVHLEGLDLELETLRLDDTARDRDLEHVANVPSLRTLQLTGCLRLTGWGFGYLGQLRHLGTLLVLNCEKIVTLNKLEGCTSLTRLDLDNCFGLASVGLQSLIALTQLQSLSLLFCRGLRDDSFMANLSGLSRLEQLNLGNVHSVTDAGLIHLSGLVTLRVLCLSRCSQITDAGVAHLVGLHALEQLYLDSCSVTDEGILHLSGLRALQCLDLSRCDGVTGKTVASLKAPLQSLYLNEVPVTDAGMAQVANIVSLHTLSLIECWRLTDVGLAHLIQLPSLTSLNVNCCIELTQEGVSRLVERSLSLRTLVSSYQQFGTWSYTMFELALLN